MNKKKVGSYAILGVLFFLPVAFLLMLYPSTHNYQPLDIVKAGVLDLEAFTSDVEEPIVLKDHITILGFLGEKPMSKTIEASNLKELIYDKFKGFKKFQIVIVMPKGTEAEVTKLKAEVNSYDDIRFWHFVYGNPTDIKRIYFSLKSRTELNTDLSSHDVFIIDKDLNQRGRIDDRTDNELGKGTAVYGLSGYNCVEVAEIKNKMSDDLRIVFTEYRQKRKGEFNSEIRRARDLKGISK
ncbi:hypothetical protein [Algibacter pacificus]|uniref:hypothetical protein n=1 Tax=Algibacter pacificus TaxID=2599389 RepID=UPI0011C8E7EE|nr:hypothetical protein [Algibacter pacificus]